MPVGRAGTFVYTISNVRKGQIEVFADGEWAALEDWGTFTLQQLRDGLVRFHHDGSEQFLINEATATINPDNTRFDITITDDEGAAGSAAQSSTSPPSMIRRWPIPISVLIPVLSRPSMKAGYYHQRGNAEDHGCR